MASDGWLSRSLRSRLGLAPWVLLVASVAFVVWILATHGEDLRKAFDLTPRLFWLITASSFATFAVNGIELQVLARRFGRRIPLNEALALGLMVSTLNYLPMKSGTVLNGVILKARYALPLSDFGALVLGSSLIHLWVALALAGASLLLAPAPVLGWGWLMLAGPTAGVFALAAWGRLRRVGRFAGHDSRLVRTASRAVDGIGLIFSDGRLLATEMAINLALIGLWAARSMWSFNSLGVDASYASVLTMSALGIVFTRLSVIPGGMGFREAGSALGSAITGLAANVGMAAAVVDRAVMLIWLLVVGVPTTAWMLKVTGVSLDAAIGSSGASEPPGGIGSSGASEPPGAIDSSGLREEAPDVTR